MERIEVTKKINFVMGHRVHNQNLPSTLGPNKCRHLHGHEYVLEVFITKEMKDDECMVIDFTFFNILNKLIQEYFDHKFMIDYNDPLFEEITGVSKTNPSVKLDFYYISHGGVTVDRNRNFNGYRSVLEKKENIPDFVKISSDCEHKSSFVIVNFVPTAENLCLYFKRIYDSMRDKGIFSKDTVVSRIRLYETQKAYAEVFFL